MSNWVLGVSLLLWLMGFLLLRHLRPCPSSGRVAPRGLLSVIIPARNEEDSLPRLLRSLAEQSPPPNQIIVVDDASTDATAEIARKHGATVISPPPLPEGWRGKTWACQQGAAAAAGDLLLFVDADTWFEPDGLGRLLGAFQGGAFSVGPYHAVERLIESLSLFFNLNMVVGTAPQGLFGQVLLVGRSTYFMVGGHESVRGRILENLHLADQFRKAGFFVGSRAGRGVCSFRMYPNGLKELVPGWSKAFASGASRARRSVLALLILWKTGLMLVPIGLAVTANWTQWGIAYLLCAAQVAWFGRKVGSFHWSGLVLYPIPLVFFFIVFARSAFQSGKEVRWKGRVIRAD